MRSARLWVSTNECGHCSTGSLQQSTMLKQFWKVVNTIMSLVEEFGPDLETSSNIIALSMMDLVAKYGNDLSYVYMPQAAVELSCGYDCTYVSFWLLHALSFLLSRSSRHIAA